MDGMPIVDPRKRSATSVPRTEHRRIVLGRRLAACTREPDGAGAQVLKCNAASADSVSVAGSNGCVPGLRRAFRRNAWDGSRSHLRCGSGSVALPWGACCRWSEAFSYAVAGRPLTVFIGQIKDIGSSPRHRRLARQVREGESQGLIRRRGVRMDEAAGSAGLAGWLAQLSGGAKRECDGVCQRPAGIPRGRPVIAATYAPRPRPLARSVTRDGGDEQLGGPVGHRHPDGDDAGPASSRRSDVAQEPRLPRRFRCSAAEAPCAPGRLATDRSVESMSSTTRNRITRSNRSAARYLPAIWPPVGSSNWPLTGVEGGLRFAL
jgi:hypothetical protein